MVKRAEKHMKGRLWSKDEELKLKHLLDAGNPNYIIAAQLGKSTEAVRQKLMRLGLKQVEHKQTALACSSSTVSTCPQPLSSELPTVEEALKILAQALRLGSNPNLSSVEIKRLHAVVKLAKTYKELLADYIDYRRIETKLIRLEEKYARLAQQETQSPAPGPNSDVGTQSRSE